MEDTYGEIDHPTACQRLLIADHFSGHRNPNVQVEALVIGNEEKEELWLVDLCGGLPITFEYGGIGYWVRNAILNAPEQKNIICLVGFAAETGKFIKLLRWRPQSYPVLVLESNPIAHLLYIED